MNEAHTDSQAEECKDMIAYLGIVLADLQKSASMLSAVRIANHMDVLAGSKRDPDCRDIDSLC